jgi:predicted HD phosphohydrolase
MDVVALFAAHGAARYGEDVTQLEHALQCAALARWARADDEVVLAALLHDLGHLVTRAPEVPGGHHGHEGAARYLCTVDPRYATRLSPASAHSLAVQGAALDLEERLALETRPWFGDAVRIRRWDDEAKVAGAFTAPLAAYRPLIERWLGPQSWRAAPGIA